MTNRFKPHGPVKYLVINHYNLRWLEGVRSPTYLISSSITSRGEGPGKVKHKGIQLWGWWTEWRKKKSIGTWKLPENNKSRCYASVVEQDTVICNKDYLRIWNPVCEWQGAWKKNLSISKLFQIELGFHHSKYSLNSDWSIIDDGCARLQWINSDNLHWYLEGKLRDSLTAQRPTCHSYVYRLPRRRAK
jgi:hypothetical protein